MLSKVLQSAFVNRYTHAIEVAVVAACLGAVLLYHGFSWTELIGSLAVLLTFTHAQIATRLAEAQAHLPKPAVECWRWAERYFIGKEVLWFVYFSAVGAWSALVGVCVFLIYPWWRKLYLGFNKPNVQYV